MYTEENRTQILNQIVAFMRSSTVFEGLIQIGSGVIGYTDVYSDIDLIAGCINSHSMDTAKNALHSFFKNHGAVYMDNRMWSKTVLGISAYFDNGLSVDISFMPTHEIPIRSKKWRLLYASNKEFEKMLSKRALELTEANSSIVNDAFHHKFFYALRRAEIAILRGNYIYADIALSEARQLLLLVEAIAEGKEVHQFKSYHTLRKSFLDLIYNTYPKERSRADLKNVLESLLHIYKDTVVINYLCDIDHSQESIINCFDDI